MRWIALWLVAEVALEASTLTAMALLLAIERFTGSCGPPGEAVVWVAVQRWRWRRLHDCAVLAPRVCVVVPSVVLPCFDIVEDLIISYI